MLRQAGIEAEEVEQVIVAGAFGSYIDVLSVVRSGLLPTLPLERFRQVGNAGGTGARMALVSRRVRWLAIDVARRMRYVELMTTSGFANGCGQALTSLDTSGSRRPRRDVLEGLRPPGKQSLPLES